MSYEVQKFVAPKREDHDDTLVVDNSQEALEMFRQARCAEMGQAVREHLEASQLARMKRARKAYLRGRIDTLARRGGYFSGHDCPEYLRGAAEVTKETQQQKGERT